MCQSLLSSSYSQLKRPLPNSVANDLHSAERLMEYGGNIEQEAAHQIPATKPSALWPAKGRIDFRNVTMRYRPDLPLALKDLSFSVGKAEKVSMDSKCMLYQM